MAASRINCPQCKQPLEREACESIFNSRTGQLHCTYGHYHCAGCDAEYTNCSKGNKLRLIDAGNPPLDAYVGAR